MIQKDAYDAFTHAATNNQTQAMQILYDWCSTATQQKLISARGFLALKNAIKHKQDVAAIKIINWMSDTTRSQMVNFRGMFDHHVLYAFGKQVESLAIFKGLYEKCNAEEQKRLVYRNF